MTGGVRLRTYEEVVARHPHLDVGRHRWRDDPPTEELSLPLTRDIHVFEPTDPRLKRHVVHDPRSRAFALPEAAAPTKAVAWERRGPILDQGSIGSCTANAALGLVMTAPFSSGATYTEQDALGLYHEETVLDDPGIPGVYPPNDTGSSGLAAMKALKARGLITAYSHAFSATAAIAALQNGPVAVGTVWLNSMFNPGPDGLITVDRTQQAAGGHEYVVDGYDPATKRVRMTNSWGPGWGVAGRAFFTLDDFTWLLAQQGDVVQPTVRVVNPQPTPPSPTPTPVPTPTDDASLWRWLRWVVGVLDDYLKGKGA